MRLNALRSKFEYNSLAAAQQPTPAPKVFSNDIAELVRAVETKCVWRDPELADEVRHLVQLCQKRGMSLYEGLSLSRSGGDCMLDDLMRHGSHEALSVLHHFLEKKTYCEGRIENTKDALVRHDSAHGDAWGFLRFGKNCVYVGALRYGQPHGKGKRYLARDWYYEGDFLAGKRHGFGVDTMEGPRGHINRGIFIDGIYRGDPNDPRQANSRTWAQGKTKRYFKSVLCLP